MTDNADAISSILLSYDTIMSLHDNISIYIYHRDTMIWHDNWEPGQYHDMTLSKYKYVIKLYISLSLFVVPMVRA